MARLSVSLLMALAVLASAVQSTPITINLSGSTDQENEILSAISQMADQFPQYNKVSDPFRFDGDLEIRISGVSGVIKSNDIEDKKPIAGRDVPARPYEWEDSLREQGYTKMGDGRSWYKLHTGGASWQDAKATCEREGAHLAVVNSEEEAQLLADEFARHRISAPYDNQMWIGVNDIDEEGHFVTVQGQDLSRTGYAEWWGGEPDNYMEVDEINGEDCVTMMRDMLLNDVHCSANMAFMCEAGDALQETAPSSDRVRNLRRLFLL